MNMDKWVQLNNQAAGRDKIARLIQYASRALWIIGIGRYATGITFGKCLDVFYASLRTIHYPDLAIRITLTMGKISQALLARTGLSKVSNAKNGQIWQ
ncbi:hypothetical protein CVS40_3031 [Lucilia cuprina]|nr:hypothetical protein CVS40_3031 [Lucilia cuprina]